MSDGGSQRPGGPGKKRASALQLELPCATLDDVRARHPELRSRPMRPHPLFASFVGAAVTRRKKMAAGSAPAEGELAASLG